MTARVSFGKQEPPYPRPGLKNWVPIRLSEHMLVRTWSMLAPLRSHKEEISLIKLILHASIALLAYFTISEERISNISNGLPCPTNGPYSFVKTRFASSSSTQHITRSGRMKSSIALPSRKNSGLFATAQVPRSRSATLCVVPTGTVDLTMTIGWELQPATCEAISSATCKTCEVSHLPSIPVGVLTQMQIMSVFS